MSKNKPVGDGMDLEDQLHDLRIALLNIDDRLKLIEKLVEDFIVDLETNTLRQKKGR